VLGQGGFVIYHITLRGAWLEARKRGEYRAGSLEKEGFVHCSTNSQILPVVDKFFKGQRHLLLLVIDPSLLTSELKYEPPSDGAPPGIPEDDLFPHVYGPINLDAVVKAVDLESLPDGSYDLPIDL
jgi:uncharacterized protein (DUF952 family)